MSTKSLETRGRTLHGREFAFRAGDLVLVKWTDGMVYFAKIKRVDHKRRKCTVVFDDKSQDEAHFSQIHSVDETTTDIICIKCKKDDSETPNEIVLCDTCGIGYHQKCHSPPIPTSALKLDTPWQCIHCIRGQKCPYLTESLDVLQNLISDESDNDESEVEALQEQRSNSSSNGTRRSLRGVKVDSDPRPPRGVKVDSDPRPPRLAAPPVDRRRSPLSNANTVRHKLASVVPVTPGDKLTTPTTLPSLHAHTMDTECKYTPETTPESTPEPLALGDRKRKKKHSHVHRKKHKRSSVDACTLFVTRLPTPGEPVRPDKVQLNGHGSVPVLEPRPRSLRVSLSIQDDCDGSVKIKTPSVKSPSQATSQTDDIFPTVTLVSPPKRKPSVISQTSKTVEKVLTPTSNKPSPPFTASPLPSQSNIPEFISFDDMFELSPTDSHQNKPLSPPVEKEIMNSKETQSKDIPIVGRDQPVLNIDVQGSKVSVVKSPTTPSFVDKISSPTVIVQAHKPLNVQPLTTTPGGHQGSRAQAVTSTPPPTTPPSIAAATMSNTPPPSTSATVIAMSNTPPPSTSATVIANTTKPNTIVPVHSKQPTALMMANTDVMIRPPASSVVTTHTPTSSKRPWTDDVIITSVEKKPRVASPSEPKPSPSTKKEFSWQQRAPPTNVLLNPAHYSLPDTGHAKKPKMNFPSPTEPKPKPSNSTKKEFSALRPPLTGMSSPTTVILSPSGHYSPLLEANKPQYVYCVQPSPGRPPIYFPANMMPQPQSSKHIKAPSTNPPVYYTNDVVSAAHVNTTKPYAIVNALPTTTGMGMYPRQLGPYEGAVIVRSPTQTDKPKTAIHTPPPPPPPPPPTSSCEGPSDDLNSHLQTINKNISAAFTSSNEDMLVTAFEDAWKKFQANGPRYSSKPVATARSIAPPNAEVVPISGAIPSRLSLVRPAGQRPRTIAPKVHRMCSRCGRDATYLCSGCRTEWYCGRDCQLKSWDSHSETCKH